MHGRFYFEMVKNMYERKVFNLSHLKYGFLIVGNIPYAESAEFLIYKATD